MNISLISSISLNNVIGFKNKIPWNLKDDLNLFRRLTLNKALIMGRITYESIGKALPNRLNIVLTKRNNKLLINQNSIIVTSSISEALLFARKSKEIMIIGGGEIYKLFFPLANRLYLTVVKVRLIGDSYFPMYDCKRWKNIFLRNFYKDINNSHDFSFKIFKRIC